VHTKIISKTRPINRRTAATNERDVNINTHDVTIYELSIDQIASSDRIQEVQGFESLWCQKQTLVYSCRAVLHDNMLFIMKYDYVCTKVLTSY